MSVHDEFMKAYEKYADALFRYCYFRVYEREKAKDLVQEIFFRTWRYIADGNSIENLRAFFYKVAYHLIVDLARKKKEISLDQLKETGYEVPYDERKKREAVLDAHQVLEKLDKLDEKYREVLLLRYIDGFSPKEIARMVGETENTISVRIHRGIKLVRQLLKKFP